MVVVEQGRGRHPRYAPGAQKSKQGMAEKLGCERYLPGDKNGRGRTNIPGQRNKQGHHPALPRFRNPLADAHHLAGGLCRKSVIGQNKTGL